MSKVNTIENSKWLFGLKLITIIIDDAGDQNKFLKHLNGFETIDDILSISFKYFEKELLQV